MKKGSFGVIFSEKFHTTEKVKKKLTSGWQILEFLGKVVEFFQKVKKAWFAAKKHILYWDFFELPTQ